MNYIVMDLEWNQATKQNNNNEKLQFEIIEIGAVKLDENFKMISKFSSMIKPTVYKKMNPYISEITGIKESDFVGMRKFKNVIADFIRWCGEEPYIFCTYGSQDIYELMTNMRYFNINIPWKYPMKYLDVQRLFSIEFDEQISHRSLETAIVFLGIKTDKGFHRAIADAIYTADVLKKLNINNFEKYQSLDYFDIPGTVKEQKEYDLGTHLEYISIGCNNKEDVMNLQNVGITRCPVCMKKCRKKTRWFSDGNKYISVANCKFHGDIEGTISIKKSYDDKYFAVRKVFQINDEDVKRISERKAAIREKRRIKRNKESK